MRSLILLPVALLIACSAHVKDPGYAQGSALESAAVVDWSGFPDYQQCLVGVQVFYPARFNALVPSARNWDTGTCAAQGACHIWIDDIPDSNTWERIPNDGTSMPSAYDMVVFPETSTNPWGHIAAVDHVDSSGNIYVMDDNYNSDERRAARPHTVWRAPYGWYHLRSLSKDAPPPQSSASCPNNGLYCGGDYVSGDSSTLYRCSNHQLSVEQTCNNGCHVNPNGLDDVCNAAPAPVSTWCPNDGMYCGGDYISGDANTLYRCSSHQLTVSQWCSNGCSVQPNGLDDFCN